MSFPPPASAFRGDESLRPIAVDVKPEPCSVPLPHGGSCPHGYAQGQIGGKGKTACLWSPPPGSGKPCVHNPQ